MKLILTTKSYLLAGSGEGQALIDADAIFDKAGLPFIPGKRIKGLLRESAEEILEMTKNASGILRDTLDSTFGKKGDQQSGIGFNNFFLQNYDELREGLNSLNPELKSLLTINKIKKYFSVEVQQTAIESGVAKDLSLRNYRVVKKGHSFEGDIQETLTDRQQALLYLAAINLKHIGTRRNRGFGLVDIKIEGTTFTSVTDAYQILISASSQQPSVEKEQNGYSYSTSEATHVLTYTIKTLSPVVIAKQRGEQNTVTSDDMIPAAAVRGMLAEIIISKEGLSKEKAHENQFFYDAILNRKVYIKDAYPCAGNTSYYPASLALQALKGNKDKTLYNILLRDQVELTKPTGGWHRIQDRKYSKTELLKTFYFHSSRNDNRAGGKSEEGGIFYYESIDSNQTFSGKIYGSRPLLEALSLETGNTFKARMGRSKTSQYGLVEIAFSEAEPVKKFPFIDSALLILASPAIFYNEYGFPAPSEENLNRYFNEFFKGIAEVKIDKMIAAFEKVENYLGTWKAKTPAETAFAEGTTFKISFNILDEAEFEKKKSDLLHFGIGERTNEGYGNLIIIDENIKLDFQEPSETNDTQPPGPPALNNTLQMMLQENYTQYNNQLIKTAAISKADKYGKERLSNSLIGRLEAMLIASNDFLGWKTILEQIKTKPAGTKLENEKLWAELFNETEASPVRRGGENELENIRRKIEATGIQIPEPNNFLEFKLYWKTFFRTVRKLNKPI